MCNNDLKKDYENFRQEINRRKITRLVHFTPTINFINIMDQSAIFSRSKLKALSASNPILYLDHFIEINDKLRLDKMETHINFSIQHINHYLFEKFRNAYRDWEVSWCIIAVSPELIWQKGTKFSIGNAASKQSQNHGIDGTFEKFLTLFQDEIISQNVYGNRIVTRDKLADCYTTDVQAEVLIPDKVPSSKILQIYFSNSEEMLNTKGAISVLGIKEIPELIVDNSLFEKR